MRKITSQQKYSPSELRSQPSMAKLVHHLVGWRHITPPERRSKRDAAKALAEAHAKERSPPQAPRLLHTTSQNGRLLSRFGLGQQTHECVRFTGPPTSRSHPQAQPDRLWRCDLSTQGRCAPSAAEPVPEQLHLCEQHLGALSHRSATGRPLWRPQGAGRLRIMGDRQRSKSRSMTFVATLAAPSRHNRVAALSIANPRRPNTPALAHATR